MANNEMVKFENCEIIWPDWDGTKDGGKPYVNVIIGADQADALTAMGVNVKTLPATKLVEDFDSEGNITKKYVADPDSDPRYYTKVVINIGSTYPPQVLMVDCDPTTMQPTAMTKLNDQNELGQLTRVRTKFVDIIASVYNWTYGKRSGVSLYARQVYANVVPSVNMGNYNSFGNRYSFKPQEPLPYDDGQLPF